jgi:surfactin synthase thioesterase subunit
MTTTTVLKSFPYLAKITSSPKKILFCFHHAGGSASVFYRYIREFSDIAIIPVELPAHGSRIKEAPVTNWQELINDICGDILCVLEELKAPFSMIGCSLGSLLAFESTVKLLEFGRKPEKLVICSHSSPDVPSPGYKTNMGYERLIDEITLLSGTPVSIADNEEMLEFYLPLIYNDYLLHDNYMYSGQRINKTDIKFFCGSEDPYFDRGNMKNWERMSDGNNQYYEYEGGHFFLYETDNFYSVVRKAKI